MANTSILSSLLQSQSAGTIKVLLKLNERLSIKEPTDQDYEKIYSKKNRFQLILISLIVCGIEFCYAAETAFVSPTLLRIGVPVQYMTMVWCLSPFFGFFACPLLGSLSDSCKSKLGRRRPFIILYSFGIVFGLILISYGEDMGNLFGNWFSLEKKPKDYVSHQMIVLLTIVGVFLLDFDCDACQSPSRAYLIDVCVKDDHSIGLSTFTIMAGIGGFLGYIIGGIPFEEIFLKKNLDELYMEVNENIIIFNNYSNITSPKDSNYSNYMNISTKSDSKHIKILFTLVLVIYIICAITTLTSFKEINLNNTKVSTIKKNRIKRMNYEELDEEITDEEENETDIKNINKDSTYNNINNNNNNSNLELNMNENLIMEKRNILMLFKSHLLSIIKMPKHMFLLCLTNFFCWMSLLCYSLYFTDFVAQEIFDGNPNPLYGKAYVNYEKGVRYGSICMALYSLSCSVYSYLLETLINKFGTKRVYIISQLIYSISMLLLSLIKTKITAILISPTAGIMYSTLFTIPYILVANYHSQETNELLTDTKEKRGLGGDIALVGSMVFLAQFLLSLILGSLVKLIGTTTIVVVSASLFSFLGSISAQVLLYLD